ncbi:MAG: hypothetical protein JSV23_06495 [Promethearchaeota archaeon]|nr:MAG: hypothetical protein JSV23_06495 [Candidatus Lokiarchaeota archaeon]
MNKIRKEKIIGIGISILIFLVSLTVLLTQEKGYCIENATKYSSAEPITSNSDIQLIWNRTWDRGLLELVGGQSVWGDGTYLYTLGIIQYSETEEKDFLLIKWDTDGNILWNQTWGGSSDEEGYSIWGDGTYLYTIGHTDSFGAGALDFALVKWDTNGNILWNQTWGGSSDDDGYSIWGDGTYLYTIGRTDSFGAGDFDFTLVKWDTNGNILWNQTWGGELRDYGFSIWGDGTYLYTIGSTDSFGAVNFDFTLVKWDTNGNILWNQTWGLGYIDMGSSVWSNGTDIYTFGTTLTYETQDIDLLLIKWDTNGNIVWNEIWDRDDYWDYGYSVWGDGTYLYTCGMTSNRIFGGNDLLLIKWGLDATVDNIIPTLSTPPDITYEEDTTGHTITWIATDANPDIYIVYKDGIQIASDNWASGIPIIINVDGLSIGSYTYNFTIFDAYDNFAIDTVIVNVIAATPEDGSIEPLGIPGYPLNVLIIVMIAVFTIVILKQKSKLRSLGRL